MSLEDNPSTLADDLLEGASAIALFLYGRADKRRRVYRLMESKGKRPPIFSAGRTLTARKSSLMRWFEQQERLAAEARK
jgi:hypothetical protein